MDQYRYDEKSVEAAQRHLDLHLTVFAEIVRFRGAIKLGNFIAPDELLSFLNDWLLGHIQGTAKKLGEFIGAKRKSARGAQTVHQTVI